LKETQRGFSYRQFSRRAGFSTSNFLMLVADGKRNLSEASIPKFARGLGLSESEEKLFEALVLLGQASSDAERNEYYGLLRRIRRARSKGVELKKAQFDVYTHWIAIPIRELMHHEDFREDPAWIAKRFRAQVKPSEVRRAITLLEKTGLAIRDDEGRLQPASPTLLSQPTLQSLAARNFHRTMWEKAIKSLDGVPQSERNITSVTVNLTAREYEQVCAEIDDFRRELLQQITAWHETKADKDNNDSGEPKEVYTLGFHVVPLTEDKKS
ncbi:MAG: TIGR02147 family protein, partial [Chrysiogenetes bacterium]|nr:TIGR02147 family protein [Chrysiogenetes bacterium]